MADRQLLLVKKETVYGTDAAATAADYIWAENVKYTPKADYKQAAPAKPGLSPVASYAVDMVGEITFDVPIGASGTAGTAPNWGKLMKMCGWSETVVAVTSVTYALMPDTSAADSGSITWREGLRTHKLLGARGNVALDFSDNERPVAKFTFRGIYQAVAAGAALAHADATFTGWKDIAPLSQALTTFTFAGTAQTLWSLSAQQNDTILFRDLPGQKNVQLTGKRAFTGKMKIKTPPVGTTNLETLCTANTVSTYSLVHGTVAGSIVTLNGRCQNGMPDYADEAGEDVCSVDLKHLSSLLSTDDDLALVLT
jgi:hypothetical protein